MEQARKHHICGFVPPQILEKIAASETADKESRVACKDTLEAIRIRSAKFRVASTVPHHTEKYLRLQRDGEVAWDIGAIRRGCEDQDRQGNNCYDGFKITHDFYSTIFGHNSLDDKGLPLIGCVHYKTTLKSLGYNNVYWDGELNHMVFGDGDNITFDYFTHSLDVIAHELSHGFVQYSSPLNYEWQSGALNESMADVFGCMVEQRHMRQTAAEVDWNVGQTLFPVAFTGSALRTLKAGSAYKDDPILGTDDQPKHMRNLYKGTADQRGVHINSGIPNHALYLAATAIGGHSWEKAGKVWYKTMTSGKITVNCDFKTFAEVTIDVASKEFPDASDQKAISGAWVKVGVLGVT